MSNELQTLDPNILSSLILRGDISGLDTKQRVLYVTNLCQRIGLDPLTQPFKILKLQGKEVLYADKGCAQQLCKIYEISTEITKKERIEDIYVVTVRATGKNGRFTDEDGAVTIGQNKGDTLANAMMKCITKAKRRAVLAYCGLGMLDDTEIETIPNAKTLPIIDIEEEKNIEKEKIRQMRQAIKDIKLVVLDKEYNAILESYGVRELENFEDLILGKEIYEKLKAKIVTK